MRVKATPIVKRQSRDLPRPELPWQVEPEE
jgi:hypothetical protein